MKNILKAIGYLLFYVVFQIVMISIIVAMLGSSGSGMEEIEKIVNQNMLGLTILTNILTIIVLLIFFKLRKKKLTTEINARHIRIKNYILPSVIAFSYSMIFAFITYRLSFDNAENIKLSVEYYQNLFPYLGITMQIIALLIVSPITEEIVCRGLILTTLQKQYNDMFSVLFSGFLFGILHLIAGGMVLVLGSMVMGMIFGLIFVKTKSLLPAIVAHTIANIPDFIMELLPELSKEIQYFSIVFFTVIFGIAMYQFICKNKSA